MQFKPHKYQESAIDFIENNPVSALFLEMGLGKTVITLTAIQDLLKIGEVTKVLVVAPLRVARDVWPEEIEKWDHLRGLRYSVAIGTPEERRTALKADADIYIINRENVRWLSQFIDVFGRFDMIVIDELSSFKNRDARRFKAMVQLRKKADRIVALTGTPSSNGLLDLWAEYAVLDLGKRLGSSYYGFKDRFFYPDYQYSNGFSHYVPKKYAEEEIYRLVEDISLSMRSLDYLDMPELIESEYPVRLSEAETGMHRIFRDDMYMELESGEKLSVANAKSMVTKLCQLANGTVYAPDGKAIEFHSKKLEALEDLIEAANGKPVLVAYYFRHDLERIEKMLTEKKIRFMELKSPQSMKEWNEGKIQVGLIQPASAGHGVNLQSGGNTLIWYSLPWSLELYQQTNARLWRQGQKAETVIIRHIIARGTIDESVLAALKRKDMSQSALMEALKAERPPSVGFADSSLKGGRLL